MEREWILEGICLLAGYLFGNFLAAEVVARCLAGAGIKQLGLECLTAANIQKTLGKPAVLAILAGDILKTVFACWFCHQLAAPELTHAAILYAGLGTMLGHLWPLWIRGVHAGVPAVLCTWILFYLPVTGLLCVLAGMVVLLGTDSPAWATVGIAVLAVPVGWLQFGTQSGVILFVTVLLCLWQNRNELHRVPREEELRSSRRQHS